MTLTLTLTLMLLILTIGSVALVIAAFAITFMFAIGLIVLIIAPTIVAVVSIRRRARIAGAVNLSRWIASIAIVSIRGRVADAAAYECKHKKRSDGANSNNVHRLTQFPIMFSEDF